MRGISSLLALLLTAALSVGQPTPPRSLVITHITVIDTAGGPALTDRTVRIRDGRIASIEQGETAPSSDSAPVLDGRGKFLIPGLWDMHVHLSWTTSSALPLLIANGVTGVRDMGGRLSELDAWRTKIAAGLLTGPRIVRAGPILNGQKFNTYQMVPGNPDETRGVVRALKEVGVDFLKTHRRLPRDSYFALIDEAKKQGLVVVGHIPMTVTPEEASDVGQATLEHTETLFEGTFTAGMKDTSLPDAIRQFRADAAEKLFARFARNHTLYTPTLVAYRSIIDFYDPPPSPDLRSRYVALSLREEARKQMKPVTAEELAGVKKTFAELREVVRQLHRSGVTLLAGSDVAGARVPGFLLHDELALLVDAGLTPLEALATATRNPATLLKTTKDHGSVETGKIADLVLLDGNPLDDIRNTQRIHAVVLDGKLLRRADLDALLREAEKLASQN